MQDLKAFRRYFNEYMHGELLKFERKRKWLVFKIMLVLSITLGIVIWVLYISVAAISLFFLIPLFSIISLIRYWVAQFKAEYKPLVVTMVLRFIDERMKYYHKDYIPLDTFIRSGIYPFVPMYYKGEDYITGKIGDVFFEMSELHIHHPMGISGELQHIFDGIFFHARFNTPFRGHVVVFPRSRWQMFIRTMKAFTMYGGREIKDVGDELFKQEFMVFADLGVRYHDVLTPDFVRTINGYHLKSKKDIYVAFHDAHFFFGIEEPRNLLDAEVFSSNLDFDLLALFYEEIYMLTRLVEDFDLKH